MYIMYIYIYVYGNHKISPIHSASSYGSQCGIFETTFRRFLCSKFVAIWFLLNLCYLVLFLYLCYHHLYHCCYYYHYYCYFFFLRDWAVNSNTLRCRVQNIHYLWELCSSTCYRIRVLTLLYQVVLVTNIPKEI